jgi:polar amino acid transport system substrate-binding protein
MSAFQNPKRIVIVTMALLLTSATVQARSLQQVINHGTLRVGVALASPWAMRDKDGELIGYDVDIARRLAADLDVSASFVIYEWDELTRAIEADEVDIVIASLTITPERARFVNFSRPHTTGGLTLATRLQSTANVSSLADLDEARFKLAVVEGTAAIELARRVVPRITVETFASSQAASEALVAGDVDAYLEEDPVPSYLSLEHPSSIDVPITRPLLETRTGFAVAKGDPDFLAYLNAWIDAHEADTWLPTTHGYWFRSLRWRDRLGNAQTRR